jgi:ribonuclease HII
MQTEEVTVKKRQRIPAVPLERFYNPGNLYELSIDEVGRGCLFGRVYVACVVLPKDPSCFDGKDIKDSKKFSSKKKLREVAEYIKQNALVWHIAWVNEKDIDEMNILQATMKGMHDCVRETAQKLRAVDDAFSLYNCTAVIDGNHFKPYHWYDNERQCILELNNVTVEQGDAKYMGIAAASILAKAERDSYVEDMCKQYPLLSERYGLNTNMGYGTKAHMDGIREHGITQWHRRTFGEICKGANLNSI